MSATPESDSFPSSTAALSADQWRFAEHIADNDRTLAVLEAGFGKTITSLLGAIMRLDDGTVKRWLVIAPLRPAKNWAQEWDDWGLNETGYTLEAALGYASSRAMALTGDADIVVINTDNIAWAAENKLLDGFDGLIIDEISKFKAVGGKAFKKLRRAVRKFNVRVGLSATPVAEGLRWLYGQVLLLDDGERLGTRQDDFLRRWFAPTDYDQRNWEPQSGALEGIVGALGDLLYCDDASYTGSGLPTLDLTFQPVKIPAETHALITELTELGEITVGEDQLVSAVNAGVATGKALQMASGFVYTDDGDAVALHTVKRAAVRLLIEHYLRQGQNVLVGYQYEWEVEQLRECYPDIVDVREAGAVERWNAGEIPVMLIHPKSGGHGLNLQYGGYTLVMWTLPWSLDLWDQLIKRLLRRGQPSDKVVVVAPVGIGTKDESVMEKLAEKLECQQQFNVYIRSNVRASK